MSKFLIVVAVLLSFILLPLAEANAATVKMADRVFTYKVVDGTYHIELTFNSETQLTWKYISAPNGETGKTSTENITRRDLRDDLLLMAWDEADGTHVIDVLDLENMKLYANFVTPSGERFLSEADVTEHTKNKEAQLMKSEYIKERVTFMSQGDEIVGDLYKPLLEADPAVPVVIILGPVAYIKEQAPTEYAKSLAKQGYAALVFDSRYHGESAGQPRRYENGDAKAADVVSAIDFVENLEGLNYDRIHLLGICQGVNWIVRAAVDEKRVKSVGLVAGHYLNNEVAEMYLGGEENVKLRLEAAQLAKEKFEQTGEVEYIPIVSLTDENALLPFKPIYDWYIPWADASAKGSWENRMTRMSELDIWGGDVTKDLSRITVPIVMIHSDKAASGSEVPKKMFEIIPTEEKQLIWFEDQVQFKFYDDPETIDRVVDQLVATFDKVK